jgi:hypothetical protein
MDLGTRTLLSVALLLALNNAVVRIGWLRRRLALFAAIQVLDVLVAGWLLWRGIPGLEEIPAVSWMLALLLLLHVVQNVRWFRAVRAEAAVDEERERKASAIRAALDED